MNNFDIIKNLPDISFIENRTLEDIIKEMKADADDYLKNQAGVDISIENATELNAEINACAVQVYHMENYIDRGAKQNLLKYSYGDFLDNLGANNGMIRNEASFAITKIRFSINASKSFVVPIVKGTKVSDGSGHIFETDEYIEIAIGSTYADVTATSIESGKQNNGIVVGAIKVMVEPVQYIDSVSNIEESTGGADVESDEDFAERIYLAPADNTKTGSRDGYIYNVKSYSSAIGDIKVVSNTAGQVNIYILMNDGSLPTSTFCQEIYNYLFDSRRAMTDYVVVNPPAEQVYNINFEYFISTNNDVSEIQAKVNQAVAEYIVWQREIGKDINPNKLTQLVLEAGAKRLNITSPTRIVLNDNQVAKVGTVTVTYGGIEND